MSDRISSLSDADLNAEVAVKVCGEVVHYRHGIAFTEQAGLLGYNVPKKFCSNFDACFAAQAALAAKGERYIDEYRTALAIVSPAESHAAHLIFLLTAPARIRCECIIRAVESMETLTEKPA